MATLQLNPNEDHTADDGGGWTLSTGSDIYAILDDSSGSWVKTSANNKDFRVGFSIFPIEPNTEYNIQNVRACITGHLGSTRSDIANQTKVVLEAADNSDYSDSDHTITVNGGSPALYCFDDSSTSWTPTLLNELRMNVEVASGLGGGEEVTIYQSYIVVTYTTTASAIPARLKIDGSLIVNGKVVIK